MNTHNYSPGQDVEALQNGQWVPAHIMNPNTNGTYDIVIGRTPQFNWSEANLRGEARPFTIPNQQALSTDNLNQYLQQWYEQRAEQAENFSPENRIEDFVGFIRERMNMDNLDAQTEQMIRQYAEQNINVLFEENGEDTQRGGRRQRRSKKRRNSKKRKTNKRRNSKRRKSRKY